MSSEWVFLIPDFVVMLALLVMPGFMWIRASIRSDLVAFAAAPAFTLGVLTLLSVLYSAAGFSWHRQTVFFLLGIVMFAGLAFKLHRRRSNPESSDLLIPNALPPLVFDAPASHAYRIFTLSQRRWMGVLILLGWLLAVLPTLITATPSLPSQQWDAVFHVNGVWHLLQHQDAGLTTALAPMFRGASGIYYPAGWHIFVALFATPTTVGQTAHLSSLVLMAVWVTGCAALTSVVTTKPAAALISPVIAGMMFSMPADALTMYVQWPHATALAALPGMLAALLIWGRRLVRASEISLAAVLRHAPLGVLLLISSIGIAHAHASALFACAWTILLPCVGATVGIYSNPKASALAKTGATVASAMVVLVPLWLLTTPHLQGMGRYPRSGIDWEYAITRSISPLPPFNHTTALLAASSVYLLLLVIGIVALIKRLHAWQSARRFALDSPADCAPLDEVTDVEVATPAWERATLGPRPAVWLIGAYLIWAFATFVAYSPEDNLRVFWLSPWYMDPRRIMGVQNMLMVPLIACGFAALVTWLRTYRLRQSREAIDSSAPSRIGLLLGVWVVIVSLFGAFDARLAAAQYVFDPDNLGKPGMVTSGELAMIQRIPQKLPRDARILGDPIAGAAYVESIGQRNAYFPHLTTHAINEPNVDLFLKEFSQIHTNPKICQALQEEGIDYVYLDADGKYYSSPRSDRAPGLYNVDVSHGFELVDSGDDAAIYRITACTQQH